MLLKFIKIKVYLKKLFLTLKKHYLHTKDNFKENMNKDIIKLTRVKIKL